MARLQLPTRGQLARFGAPAAFLLGVTVAVLLVRAGLADSGGSAPATTPTTVATTLPETTATTATIETSPTTTTTPEDEARFYTIERGDTLATVAANFGTTVEQLLTLNPGVDPTELRIGQRIRVE